MEPTPDTIKWPRTRDWTGNRPKGKSTTNMLLKEQNNKITPSFNPPQRYFLLTVDEN